MTAVDLVDQRQRHRPHLRDDVPNLRGHRDLREPHPGDLRDMQGQVAHALQVGHQVQRRDQYAQIGGHRLLPGDHLERALVELLTQRVDVGVVGDHPFGPGEVAVEQRLGRPFHGIVDQLGHGVERLADVVEFVVVNIAHLMSIPLGFLAREPSCLGRILVVSA